jgi:hypothetical protein
MSKEKTSKNAQNHPLRKGAVSSLVFKLFERRN